MPEVLHDLIVSRLKVWAWNSNRAKEQAALKARYIDEVWPGLKP